MYQNKLITNFSMKFHATCIINLYSANRIGEWTHAKTKNTQCKYLEMYKIPNKYLNPNSKFKLVL